MSAAGENSERPRDESGGPLHVPGGAARDALVTREHRRRRMKRHRRRAYIRSVYSLPSLATLGNAVCGFGSIYVASLGPDAGGSADPVTRWLALHGLTTAAYLIFLAMIFDALDGRLARFARHTTDFGGQLDSLADVLSFGAAPAFLALQVVRTLDDPPSTTEVPYFISRAVWAVGAMYMSCAALRLARFNVSNEHGEQHHFSFLGLPSPGAGGAVAAFVLLQQELWRQINAIPHHAGVVLGWMLPPIVLLTGLLMVSNIRYPHLVNRYLRGRRSIGRVLLAFTLVLLLIVAHQYTVAIATLAYAFWGPVGLAYARMRPKLRGPAAANDDTGLPQPQVHP